MNHVIRHVYKINKRLDPPLCVYEAGALEIMNFVPALIKPIIRVEGFSFF